MENFMTNAQGTLLKYWDKFINYFPMLVLALIIFISGMYISKVVSKTILKVLTKAKVDSVILSFIMPLLEILFKVVVIILTLSTLGVNVSAMIAALGASLVTIGLALKDSLSNMACGMLIIMNKPFRMGDYLEISGYKGTITKIELMFTILVTVEGNTITIPNSKVLSSVIMNYKNPETIEESISEEDK